MRKRAATRAWDRNRLLRVAPRLLGRRPDSIMNEPSFIIDLKICHLLSSCQGNFEKVLSGADLAKR